MMQQILKGFLNAVWIVEEEDAPVAFTLEKDETNLVFKVEGKPDQSTTKDGNPSDIEAPASYFKSEKDFKNGVVQTAMLSQAIMNSFWPDLLKPQPEE